MTLTDNFFNFTGKIRVPCVSSRTGAHGNVLLDIANGQHAAGAWTGIGTLESNASQLWSTVVVRFAFSVTSLLVVVGVSDKVWGTGTRSSSVSLATLSIWTAWIR